MTGTEEPTPKESSVRDWVGAERKRIEAEQAALLEGAGYSSLDEVFSAAAKQAREQAMPAPTWTDLEDALAALASEDHVAQRLEYLRGRAGLSQEQLAKKLETLGVQMPQSSISKIEAPVKTGKGKRRDITVDEALALAKALGVPLTELLLPDDALADLRLHRILADGSRLWQSRNVAQLDYDYAVTQLAEAAAGRPDWHQRLTDEIRRLTVMETGVDEQGVPQFRVPVATTSSISRKTFVEDVLCRVDEIRGNESEKRK